MCPVSVGGVEFRKVGEPKEAISDQYQRVMRVIFDPSSVRLYMRPFGSRTNPTTGLVILFVSIDPPIPTVMMATDPSTPIFQPAVDLNCWSAGSVMNMMITEFAWTPSWKPIEADIVL